MFVSDEYIGEPCAYRSPDNRYFLKASGSKNTFAHLSQAADRWVNHALCQRMHHGLSIKIQIVTTNVADGSGITQRLPGCKGDYAVFESFRLLGQIDRAQERDIQPRDHSQY